MIPIELLSRIETLEQIVDQQEKMIGAMQAKIDELMLEYEPEEMTPLQILEWSKHQVPCFDKLPRTFDEV